MDISTKKLKTFFKKVEKVDLVMNFISDKYYALSDELESLMYHEAQETRDKKSLILLWKSGNVNFLNIYFWENLKKN